MCGVRVAHGGYEIAEVYDVRKTGERRGLFGGPGKRVDGVFPRRPQTLIGGRLQPRTRGNGAERRIKGRNISFNGSLQITPGLDDGMQSYART